VRGAFALLRPDASPDKRFGSKAITSSSCHRLASASTKAIGLMPNTLGVTHAGATRLWLEFNQRIERFAAYSALSRSNFDMSA
jgi:hypothetical protein